VLLEFTNLYRQFIRKDGKVTTPISDLLKKAETSRMPKQLKWEWTRYAELVLQKLKRAFTDSPILNHSDLAKPLILQTDASGVVIARILNQYEVFGILGPDNFYSHNAQVPNRTITCTIGSSWAS
jgi:hypothetical protein